MLLFQGAKKGRFRVPGNIYSAYMFYRKLFIQCDNISIYFKIINYKSSSPARTIPACRHFLNRQYWHRFLCTLFISHSPEPPTHVYTRRFCVSIQCTILTAICSLDCTGWKPTNEICIERMVPRQ